MRAAVVHRYGPPETVTVEEVEPPTLRRGDALIRVEAAAVTAGDARMRSGTFPDGFALPARLAIGVRGPRKPVLGIAVAGVIEHTGSNSELVPGDRVTAMIGARLGGHAELAAVPAHRLVPIPREVSNESAAGLIFGGTTALFFLRDRAGVASGERVLINGASGAVGSSAVQLAKHFGAHVVAVTSAANRDFALRLGADQHIDYERQPLHQLDGEFDVVFDAVGNVTRASGRRLLAPGGRLILAVASLGEMLASRGEVITGTSPERPADVSELLRLAAEGALDPVTQLAGGLDSIRDAYRIVDAGHKVGNLVIQPQR